MAALNAGDEPALLATLHVPHYRRAGGRMQVWDQPGVDLATFSPVPARTGTTANGIFARLSPPDRPRCIWTYNSPVIASTNSDIGSFRSLWILTETGGRWGVAAAVELR